MRNQPLTSLIITDEYANQPRIEEWGFVEQLRTPLHVKTIWTRQEEKGDEASLKDGVSLDFMFPDPDSRLDTAHADFKSFLTSGQICGNGKYSITTARAPTSCFEEYIISVDEKACRIFANDTEGIRRALVHVEDMMKRCGGPFLPIGRLKRKPFIRTRLSRCFFGPIKRPPLNRDELLDDVDYYPDEYLNRLAHEGINGLWISIEFRDMCPSRFFPSHGRDCQRRFEKLRSTIRKCARYGIKIYVYCNEPVGFGEESFYLSPSHLEKHPYFAGCKERSGQFECTYFCTSSKEGQDYLEDCASFIFSNAPELGGMICINFWERPTNCYSYSNNFIDNNCPRCGKRKPWEVFHDTLAAFVRGIKKAAPDAEFISWLYTPELRSEGELEILKEIVAHAPQGATMQLNFESNGKVRQLNREFTAYDYWLSWAGPSKFFADCAINAEVPISAKIQVGCSHENATIPFMPVPGSLYRKYRTMKKLGVSVTTQCWYFGNYPGLMNKAAGELSFLPFPKSEGTFLEKLASVDWGANYEKVAAAWKLFMKGYSHFPISLPFAYFGPLHCSIVWPLHLYPVDQPIAPSWEFGYPDSGDRIGECIGFYHSLEETLILLNKMERSWRRGVAVLSSLECEYAGNRDRLLDIGLCKAIGLQIRSAKNVISFYGLRERLPFMKKAAQSAALKRMEDIVRDEISNCRIMRCLCRKDARLGFHSEAEGYKFFPAKLDWRAGLLKHLLKEDFPKLRKDIKAEKELFAEYTGVSPKGKTYDCGGDIVDASPEVFDDGSGQWKAWHDGQCLHFEVRWRVRTGVDETIQVNIEPRRLWPVIRMEVNADGRRRLYSPSMEVEWNGDSARNGELVTSSFSIPFSSISYFDPMKALRANVYQSDPMHNYICGWIGLNPLKARAMFGSHNSADLGWLKIRDHGLDGAIRKGKCQCKGASHAT